MPIRKSCLPISLRSLPALALSCLLLPAPAQAAPQQPAQPQEAPAPTIQLNVNRVLVPVVVRDAAGRSIPGLKQENFQVLDNDKPRPVSGFTVDHRGAPSSSPASPAQLAPSPPPAPAHPATPPQAIPGRILIFLFDDLHIGAEDLIYAKKAASRVLSKSLTGSTMAAVISLSGKTNSGLTRDPSALETAIAAIQPRGVYRAGGNDCPDIGYYQADLIENKRDANAFQDALRKVTECNPAMNLANGDIAMAQAQVDTTARRALTIGHQDARATSAIIGEFVRRVAGLPGQRTIILISSGFLTIEPDVLAEESRVMDMAAQANITISTLDARGLYAAESTASQRSPALGGNSLLINSEYQRTAMTLGESPLSEIANGTGGTFFHASNDLEAGLKRLADEPEDVYVLDLPLDAVKPDGTWHSLKVKVDVKGAQVQARRGYFVPKPPKVKK